MPVAHPPFRVHSLRLSDFDYEIPRGLVAGYPAEPRDAARLMVLDRGSGSISHRLVSDLPEYFGEGDVLVVNDTMVFPARLRGVKETTGARVEVFLLRELNPTHRLWDSIVDPARKIRVGNKLVFADGLAAEVLDNTTSRGRTLRFMFDGTPEALYDVIDAIGETPIPPYLRRAAEPADRVRYQTLFARRRGAVAAPTSGLHFTPDLVRRIEGNGTEVVPVTLHTALGTFQPVEAEDLARHHMDSEFFDVSQAAVDTVNPALGDADRTVTVCGVSTVRAMESTLSASKALKAGSGWTDKFIYPVYDFHTADRMLVNFYRPRSTPLVTAATFAGYDLLMAAYDEAIREEYRLYSFGDAMLIL